MAEGAPDGVTDIAKQIASSYFNYGVLGVTVVVLLLAIIAITYFGWRELKAAYKLNDDLQAEWREETKAANKTMADTLATLDRTTDLFSKAMEAFQSRVRQR